MVKLFEHKFETEKRYSSVYEYVRLKLELDESALFEFPDFVKTHGFQFDEFDTNRNGNYNTEIRFGIGPEHKELIEQILSRSNSTIPFLHTESQNNTLKFISKLMIKYG